ncbi:MAG: sulfur carrier protein ThiS [Victivallales bacterium]|nr:sulfur carrier protein ThiS [Victivallales bacterium]
MKLVINGTEREFPAATAGLKEILAALKLNTRSTVCLVNGEAVPPEQYGTMVLADNDKLDLLSFVGGG